MSLVVLFAINMIHISKEQEPLYQEVPPMPLS